MTRRMLLGLKERAERRRMERVARYVVGQKAA
jgi:hypothetical protein